MRKRILFSSLVVSILVFSLVNTAVADEFSADIVSTAKGQVFQGKVYMGKDKMRMENPQSISITRIDKKVLWLLMPSERQYIEQPFDTSTFIANSDKVSGEIERKLVGSEVIDGKSANKYKVTYLRDGIKSPVFQWLIPGLAIPIKTASLDGSWAVEYKNIKLGRQPDSLFEIPPGYQKFSYPQLPLSNDMLKNLADELF